MHGIRWPKIAAAVPPCIRHHREDCIVHRTNLFLVTCVLAVSTAPLWAKTPDSSQACWQPAFEASDADAVAACYAPDAVLWLPGTPMMKGREAIRAGYAGFFADS